MNWPAFWQDFWPNLASTFASIVLGIPSALWVERLIERRAEERTARAANLRLQTAVIVLCASLDVNRQGLAAVVDSLKDAGSILLAPSLDSSTWMSMRSELETLSDLELVSELARLFMRIQEVRRLLIRYEELFFTSAAALGRTVENRNKLREAILRLASEAGALSAELKERLQPFGTTTPQA